MLPLVLLRFHFAAAARFRHSHFPEAAWRGAFGYALKRTVCLTHLRACAGCTYEFTCAYPFIFETRPGSMPTVLGGTDRTPHPFVLRVPAVAAADLADSERVTIELVLIGDAAPRHLSPVIHAMSEAAVHGIGKSRTRMLLEAVTDADGNDIWRPGSNLTPAEPHRPKPRLGGADTVSLHLVSPLRLVRQGSPIGPEALDGPSIGFAAVRRVGLLAACFGDDLKLDFKALKAEAEKVKLIDRSLVWLDRSRFSTRQNRLITYGGLVGDMTLDVSEAPGVLACLETCQTVHVGKGATLGYGWIALAAA